MPPRLPHSRNFARGQTRRRWTRIAASLAAAAVFLAAERGLARPGGGQSFRSGGGGSYGGGHAGGAGSFGGGSYGGGGFGDHVTGGLLFWLFFSHPLFGGFLILLAAFLAYRWFKARAEGGSLPGSLGDGSSENSPVPLPRDMLPGGPSPNLAPSRELETLQADDPAFSLTLFEDFLYVLYAQVQEARGRGQLESLAPYLAPEARASLAVQSEGLAEVRDVIVGGLRIASVSGLEPGSDQVEVQVRFESNYTEVRAAASRTFWSVELWNLTRRRTAQSRSKDKIELLRCPSCGAPLDGIRSGVCSYCHQRVDTGDFDWLVTRIGTLERLHDLPAPEPGGVSTFLRPTVVDGDAAERLDGLGASDPTFEWQGFVDRVNAIFGELQLAWSTLDWPRARPYVTDSLYRSQNYWIDRYRLRHLRNVTENAQLERVQAARVMSDATYDAITVHVTATGLDYTLDEASGQVVEGSRTAPTRYGEYWTLVRGRGVKGASSGQKTCPSCGAPLKINMAGNCEYCRAHITSGEFDWVLSRIEQDEAYA